MRLFVAADVDDAGLAAIAALQERLRRESLSVRWTQPATWHLTLAFLGETEPARVDGIAAACAGCGRRTPPFSVELAGTGAFPTPRAPRVLFAGVKPSPPLALLAANIVGALVPLGFRGEERPFSPHITLGRVKDPRAFSRSPAGFVEMFAAAGETFSHTFRVTDFHLYESTLDQRGPSYMRLASFPLEGAAP